MYTGNNSTQINIDLLAQDKKLRENIKVLTHQKLDAEAEFKQWVEARNAVQKELEALLYLNKSKEEISQMTIPSMVSQKVELIKEINNLIEKREKIVKEKDSLSSENETTSVILKEKKEQLEKIKNDIVTKFSELNSLHNKTMADIERETKELNIIKIEKQYAIDELKVVKEDVVKKTEFVRKEEIRLSIKENDLAIWESRLQKKYVELYPGQALNL